LDASDPAAARALITARVPDQALRQRTIALWAAMRGQPVDEAPVVPKPAVDGPGPRLALVHALTAARRADAAGQVIAAAPEPERLRLRLAVTETTGDAKAAVPMILEAGPRLAGLRRSGAYAVFDLALADGSPIRLPATVVVDGLELPVGRVERVGQRFVVPVNQGPTRIEVRIGGTAIATGTP
jgi:hypothetical protein